MVPSSRRLAQRIIANTLACMIVMLGGLVLRMWYPNLGGMFICLGSIGTALGLMFVPRVRHRWATELEAQGFCVCPKCECSLQDLPPSGRCPKCGEDYDPQSLIERWQARLRVRRKKEVQHQQS